MENQEANEQQGLAMEEELLGYILERVISYRFDFLIDALVHTVPPEAKDTMLHTDKFGAYRHIWQGTLNALYKRYLPGVSLPPAWKIELTPYTLMVCSLIKDENSIVEYKNELLQKSNLTEAELLEFNRSTFSDLGIDVDGFSGALKKCLPQDELDRFFFLYRIMNFPPLQALAHFYRKLFNRSVGSLQNLLPHFAPKMPAANQLPEFHVLEPLHHSVIPFSHTLFSKYGLSYFEKQQGFEEYRDELEAVRQKAEKNKDSFTGSFICSCCGQVHSATVPLDMLEYKYLLEQPELTRQIGFHLLPEVEKEYIENISAAFTGFIQNLNSARNAKLIILVEGASEETGLPIIALRKKILLIEKQIHIHNSGSKEKLYQDFLSFKSKHPDTRIICLLDKDAVKESADIGRGIRNKRHKYDMVYLEAGTWEDIFPLEVCVQALNKLYPDGDEILIDDFNQAKEFNKQINDILFKKKLAGFDKVRFSKMICSIIDLEKLPVPITELFDKMEKFLSADKSMMKTSDKKD